MFRRVLARCHGKIPGRGRRGLGLSGLNFLATDETRIEHGFATALIAGVVSIPCFICVSSVAKKNPPAVTPRRARFNRCLYTPRRGVYRQPCLRISMPQIS
jgi:hypothetical protein